MSDLTTSADRHWFITGASGGMGQALAERALREGDSVTATVRRAETLDDLRRRFDDRLFVELLDLSHPEELPPVVDRTQQRRPVDIVVNNAGYVVVGGAEETSVAQVRDQVEVMLVAPMLVTRAFLGSMRERGGGRIIQISSMGGQVAIPTHSTYHAAKWGLEGFSESVSQEVAEFGIGVTIVEPGGTRTGFATGMSFAEEIPAYAAGAVGRTRQQLASLQPADLTGDPERLAAAVYDTTRQADPPLRLVLGADTYQAVDQALRDRLADVEAQQGTAGRVAFH